MISIVAPVNSRLSSAKKFYDSIYYTAGGFPWELIWVDTAGDPSIKPLFSLPNTKVVSTFVEPGKPGPVGPQGFFCLNAAWNKGADEASGSIIIRSISDIEIRNLGWMQAMDDIFLTNPLVGCISGRLQTDYQHYGALSQECGRIITRDWFVWITGQMSAFRADTWKSIGGMDERLQGYGWDEAIAARSVLLAGKRIANIDLRITHEPHPRETSWFGSDDSVKLAVETMTKIVGIPIPTDWVGHPIAIAERYVREILSIDTWAKSKWNVYIGPVDQCPKDHVCLWAEGPGGWDLWWRPEWGIQWPARSIDSLLVHGDVRNRFPQWFVPGGEAERVQRVKVAPISGDYGGLAKA